MLYWAASEMFECSTTMRIGPIVNCRRIDCAAAAPLLRRCFAMPCLALPCPGLGFSFCFVSFVSRSLVIAASRRSLGRSRCLSLSQSLRRSVCRRVSSFSRIYFALCLSAQRTYDVSERQTEQQQKQIQILITITKRIQMRRDIEKTEHYLHNRTSFIAL